MKFIHVRGSMGVGKTTAVRQFLERGNFESRTIEILGASYPYNIDRKQKIIITGRYGSNKCGGLDGIITDKNLMKNYLFRLIRMHNAEYIIFEAVMYGHTYRFSKELNDGLKKIGYDYIALSLIPPIQVALDRVYLRNNGNKINVESFMKNYLVMQNSSIKLKSDGVNTKIIDTSEIKEYNMWQIIQKEIK